MENNLLWKTNFDGRWPSMEDDLRRKMTFVGRQSFTKDDLWWKTTFDGRQPSMEDDQCVLVLFSLPELLTIPSCCICILCLYPGSVFSKISVPQDRKWLSWGTDLTDVSMKIEWDYLERHGSEWFLVVFGGFKWFSVVFGGFQWFSVVFDGSHWF